MGAPCFALSFEFEFWRPTFGDKNKSQTGAFPRFPQTFHSKHGTRREERPPPKSVNCVKISLRFEASFQWPKHSVPSATLSHHRDSSEFPQVSTRCVTSPSAARTLPPFRARFQSSANAPTIITPPLCFLPFQGSANAPPGVATATFRLWLSGFIATF